MSGESAAQGSLQMAESDYLKLLDSLFLGEQYANNVEVAFDLFEKNFSKYITKKYYILFYSTFFCYQAKQPYLVNVLVNYYFGSKLKQDNTNEYYSYANNELLYNPNKKSIIDLLCLIPDDLSNVKKALFKTLAKIVIPNFFVKTTRKFLIEFQRS
jgi:hypothetical protein